MATEVVASAEANAQSSLAIYNEYDAPEKRPDLPRKDTKFSSTSTLVTTSPYAVPPTRTNSEGVIDRGRSSPAKAANPLRYSMHDKELDPVYKPKSYVQGTTAPSGENKTQNGTSGNQDSSAPGLGIPRRQVGLPKHRYPMNREELANALALCETENKEKDEEIKQLKAQNEMLLQEWRVTSANLAQTKATVTHTIEDQHFISVWSELRYQIRGWANQHFSGKLGQFTKWKNHQLIRNELTVLSKHYKAYMKSEEHRPLLIQAFVWAILYLDIFAPTGQVPSKGQATQGVCWAADDQKSLLELSSNLRPAIQNIRNIPKFPPAHEGYIKDYFSWRANTTLLIERKQGAQKGRLFDIFIPSIIMKIREIVSPWATSGESPDDIFGADLFKILRKAIHLDADMWKQKAFFHPVMPSSRPGPPVQFDPEVMDVCEEIDPSSSSQEVTLIISPALVKSGSSSGEGYEYFTTIVNSEVSCKPEFRRDAIASPPQASPTSPRQESQSITTLTRAPSNSKRSQMQSQPGKFDTSLRSQKRPSIDVTRSDGEMQVVKSPAKKYGYFRY